MVDEVKFPFSDDDEDEEQDETPAGQSKPFSDLRKKVREQNRELKELRALKDEAEALRTFKQEIEQRERTTSLKGVFESIGLSEAQTGLYPADAETSEDAVKTWASQFGLIAGGGDESAGDSGDKGFTPVSTGAPRSGASGGRMSHEEWVKLQQEGRLDEAKRAFIEGRVDMSGLGGKYA